MNTDKPRLVIGGAANRARQGDVIIIPDAGPGRVDYALLVVTTYPTFIVGVGPSGYMEKSTYKELEQKGAFFLWQQKPARLIPVVQW